MTGCGVVYVRFESATPNARGAYPGIFALANGLAQTGRLSPSDWAWWRVNNDWFDRAYPNPGAEHPELFDRTRYPVVACWFKNSAHHLLARVPGYLDLLDRYGVAWTERRTTTPGTILYEDTVQVVVTPTVSL